MERFISITTTGSDIQVEEYESGSACPAVHILPGYETRYDDEAITTVARQPFKLEQEFAVRWVLVQHTSSILLYLVSHHIMLDGTSMSLLSTELVKLLDGDESQPIGKTDTFS